jgi:hypothetical protein
MRTRDQLPDTDTTATASPERSVPKMEDDVEGPDRLLAFDVAHMRLTGEEVGAEVGAEVGEAVGHDDEVGAAHVLVVPTVGAEAKGVLEQTHPLGGGGLGQDT